MEPEEPTAAQPGSPEEAPLATAPPETPSTHSRLADAGLATLLVAGYVSPLLALLIGFVSSGSTGLALSLALVGLVGAVWVVVWLYRNIRRRGRGPALGWVEVLVLVILPAWGLAYNHMAKESCQVLECEQNSALFRPLAEPEVFGLLAFHAVTALAYVASRRRPQALQPALAELSVHASLLSGMVIHALLAVHFGKWVLAGVAFPPAFLPCLSPVLTLILYGAELRHRLRLRGADARSVAQAQPLAVYREVPAQSFLPQRIHRPTLLRALAVSPALLGLHAVLQAVWLGQSSGALQVFTRTCDYTLSRLPVEVIPGSCHYLCTVAARGHSWLVRPLRMGRRGGVPIVVNRQLAVANAFEDLLHERWPRFGRLARRTYDLLARPICNHLRPAWVSDIVYLVMKPAEWAFYLALVLLDPRSPEARIDRMYR
ncbi:DUF6688 domain-containing protein [Polyangium spumosum]|uniref:Uncharacterized protein n=1 Tax=Polyangium spumosum TaxID=889282 RepID=A0A6N7PLK3_9BACT|nr:SoxR reducing system RseC family protein [Polyangium spumosum]MRG92799.1 hypothetical protein [Polyangium spumosum]